jgi:hypothetical protein
LPPSNIWKKSAGEIDDGVPFRPARGEGLTKGQVKYKKDRQTQILEVETEMGLRRLGEENKWVGEKMPRFEFVSLAPRTVGVTDKLHDAVVLSPYQVNKLSRNNWIFLKELDKTTGTIIDVGERGGHLVQEVGFFGTKAGIEKAKKAVEDRVVRIIFIPFEIGKLTYI